MRRLSTLRRAMPVASAFGCARMWSLTLAMKHLKLEQKHPLIQPTFQESNHR